MKRWYDVWKQVETVIAKSQWASNRMRKLTQIMLGCIRTTYVFVPLSLSLSLSLSLTLSGFLFRYGISPWDFPLGHPRRVWPTLWLHVRPARTVLWPFIFGTVTAWILITFGKAVRVSRARRSASDRKRGNLPARPTGPAGKFSRPAIVRRFSTKFASTNGRGEGEGEGR